MQYFRSKRIYFVQILIYLLQVEVWLNRLLDAMKDTVRHEMTESVTAYEEKPRDQWLFDYPAQVNMPSTFCTHC